jgi:hypothetical protein
MKILVLLVALSLTLLYGCQEPSARLAQNSNISESTDNCKNYGRQTLDSPNGLYKAVIFSRNCGNDTSVNTNISILRNNEALPDQEGNTFVVNHKAVPIKLNWTDNAELEVSGVSVDVPDRQNSQVSGVEISFRKSSNAS